MKTAFLAAIICLTVTVSLQAQWTHFAERNRVRAIELSSDGGSLWYTTGGGLVRYDTMRRVRQTFGRTEGLPAADLNALLIFPDGMLALGTEDKGLILGNGSGRWSMAGAFDGLPDTRVLCLTRSHGESGYRFWAGTSSGAREFVLQNGAVSPAGSKMILLENTAVYDIACQESGEVWFAGSTGLWRLGTDNSLRRYGVAEGVGYLTVTQVEVDGDGQLYAAWRDTLKALSNGVFIKDDAPAAGMTVTGLRLLDNQNESRLALTAGGRLFLRDGSGWSEIVLPIQANVIGPAVVTGGLPVLGTDGEGLLLPESGAYSALKLPGPLYNLLTRVAVDSRGVVWCSGASDATPRAAVGVNRWDGNNWRHFTEANSPLLMNMIASLNAGPDNRMYLGTWFGPTIIGSGGFNILDDHGTADSTDDNWETYTANETPLSMGVIRGDMAFDSTGGVWVGSQFNQQQPGGLERFDPQSKTFASYSESLAERAVRTVEVDGLGNVWIGYQHSGLGVIPGGYSGGEAPRQVSTFASALGETGILDLAVDPANRVWIVTPSKTVVLNFQENARDESRFNYTEVKPPDFGGLAANAVELQGIEAAWLATDDGLWRYNITRDTWSVFNTGNSGIASDRVNDIALDRGRNVIWAATADGLAALSLDDSRELPGGRAGVIVRPNPWRPLEHGRLSLEGIPRYSQVTIFSVSGQTVRTFESRDAAGGILLWDGENQSGRACAAGVYIILARAADGSTLSGKVALLR